MTGDDVFAVPEIDVFPFEVDALVTSVYQAAIAGIEALDKQERAKFKTRTIDSHPELQQESWWWDDQIQDMKVHAGNMGLVSLISLFDHWLVRRQQGNRWLCFKKLEERFGKGPLSLIELEEIVTARNSIIHHRCQAEFTDHKQKPQKVKDQFVNFDNGIGQVAVEADLLTDLSNHLKSQVAFWNREGRR